MPPKRMTANPVKPARYRAGKPTGNESSSDSSDASDNEEEAAAVEPAEAEAAEARRIAREKAERLAAEEGFVTEEESEGEEEEGDGDEDEEDESGSEEDDSSSEEEAPRRLMMRPKFVPKSQRGAPKDTEKDEEATRLAEEEARKAAADELDLAARAAGKKHWDDEENENSDVDTTDGLDPEAEEAAWRVRELKRLKRARTAIEERERELAEVERRRNLTEEERQVEDEEFLAKQKEEKDGKGTMAFMQRYFHKGAFFQEETAAAGLLQRDIMGSRIQDDVRNREALPEYLRKRDMTKLGRKSGTKYKDMKTEDTGRWGSFDDRRRDGGGGSGSGGGRYDGDDRFRPDDDRFKPDERDETAKKGGTVTDETIIGTGGTEMEVILDLEEGEDRRDGGSDRRPRDNDRDRRRAYSRSRSPRRDRDDHRSRRKRSTSRDDRYDSDKRRKVDT
ncbi:Microfibrillar-associated protein 1B [Cladobotryum mycophilum]|uniref:Microfibrillar-associated protein 1B n=1 Tax=Cladobotryum mycophilum TaxID=491253 RepID=A0ABR0SMV4_9HYPO